MLSNKIKTKTRMLDIILSLAITCCTFSAVQGQTAQSFFVEQPWPRLDRPAGHDLRIPCVVAQRQSACVWLHNNHIIFPVANLYEYKSTPDNGDCSLYINQLSRERHNGTWQCQVPATAHHSHLHSTKAEVIVLEPPGQPQIVRSSESQILRVIANETQEITCRIESGNPMPQIIWRLLSQDISDRASIKVEQVNDKVIVSSVLRYSFDKLLNKAALSCDALHPLINQSDVVTLDIVYAPIVTLDRSVYQVRHGNELQMTCNVDANPPVEYTHWYREEIPNIQFGGDSILYLERVPKEMNKQVLECQAKNEVGLSNKAKVQLDVLYEPELIEQSNVEKIRTGNDLNLLCKFEGNPKPIVSWIHLQPVLEQITLFKNSNEDEQHLEIKNVTYRNEGQYQCEASNNIFGLRQVTKGKPIPVNVYGLPDFIDDQTIAEGKIHKDSVVTIRFCSDPAPRLVFWKFDSYRLNVDSQVNTYPTIRSDEDASTQQAAKYLSLPLVPIEIRETTDFQNTCFEAKLVVKNTQLTDEIEYSLSVRNEYGENEKSVLLRTTTPLTLPVVAAIVIVIFAFLIAFGMLVIVVIRRRRKANEHDSSDELKEEIDGMHPKDLESGKSTEAHRMNVAPNGDSYELVYANLEFNNQIDPNSIKQTQMYIPQAQQSLNMHLPIQQQQSQQQQPLNMATLTQATAIAQPLMHHSNPLPGSQQVLPINPNQPINPLQVPPKKQPPATRPKPQIRPQHMRPAQPNSIEYAKLAFATKADL